MYRHIPVVFVLIVIVVASIIISVAMITVKMMISKRVTDEGEVMPYFQTELDVSLHHDHDQPDVFDRDGFADDVFRCASNSRRTLPQPI